MKFYRIIVTGHWDLDDQSLVNRKLDKIVGALLPVSGKFSAKNSTLNGCKYVIMTCGGPGADRLAEDWATNMGVSYERWQKDEMENMAKLARAAILFQAADDPDDEHTRRMRKTAKRYNLQVRIITLE